MLLTPDYGQRQANLIPIPRDLACSFVRVGYSLLPQAVIADELAVDPGLADPQVGLGLEFIFNGGERHVAGIKQHQRLLDAAHQLAHFADVAFEQGALQHARDLGVADQSLVARVFIHAEKHHGRTEGGDLVGQIVDGVVVAEHHQIGIELPVEGQCLLGHQVELVMGAALGIHVEVAEVVLAVQMGLQAGVVTLIPQVFGVIAADHQDLGRPQPAGQEAQQQ